jgi:hypothetical protein
MKLGTNGMRFEANPMAYFPFYCNNNMADVRTCEVGAGKKKSQHRVHAQNFHFVSDD